MFAKYIRIRITHWRNATFILSITFGFRLFHGAQSILHIALLDFVKCAGMWCSILQLTSLQRISTSHARIKSSTIPTIINPLVSVVTGMIRNAQRKSRVPGQCSLVTQIHQEIKNLQILAPWTTTTLSGLYTNQPIISILDRSITSYYSSLQLIWVLSYDFDTWYWCDAPKSIVMSW